jgi:2-desacetyl-2-hydroxyethyl bacteriochlorophyllide A dehydrogenase
MSHPVVRETKHRTSAQSDARGLRDEAAGSAPAALFYPGACCQAQVVRDHVSNDLMPAAVYVGGGEIEVQQVPVPDFGPAEALIEISHCGICGTDLHLVLERYARPGSVLGHEWAGTIAALGADVSGWEIGARVVLDPTPGCGRCRACMRGRSSVCVRRKPPDLLDFSRGAFCRYKVVPAAQLLRVPDALSTRDAALTEPTAIALHTVNLAHVSPDDRVLVTGGGPVGLLTTAVLRSRGVRDIVVSEPAPARRRCAVAVGATTAVAPDELPRAQMGRPVDAPFTVAFECSGHAAAAESALDQLDYAGTLVFVGTGSAPPRVNHNRVIVMEQTLIGAYNYDAEGFRPALELLASGALPLNLLIEPVDIRLDEVLTTMHRLTAGELPGKVMVTPEVSA